MVLSPSYAGKDGVSRVTAEIMRALGSVAESREALLLSGETTDAENVHGWNIRSAYGSRVTLSRWGIQAGLIDQRHTLVIVLHGNIGPIALPMKLRGARVVVFLHGIEVWKRLKHIRRCAFQMADLLIANSSYTASRFRRANPWIGHKRVVVCPLGVGSPDPAPRLTESSTPLVLIVGRMVIEERYKGHDRLLECWPLVRRAVANAQLCVVGDGDDRQRLEHKCRALGVSESVRFAGRIPDSDLGQLYCRCSLFVMPSREEGFGLVFLEAMRAGKPCIAGDGAAREVVQDGVTGLIDSTNDAAGLARTIVQLLQDPGLRERMGQAGFDRYCREFTAVAFSRRLRIDLAVEDVGCTQYQ